MDYNLTGVLATMGGRLRLPHLDVARMDRRDWFVGDAATVAGEIRALAVESQTDEGMITTALPNQADRLRTIREIAREWQLKAPIETTGT